MNADCEGRHTGSEHNYAPGQGNLFALEAARVTTPVPTFVVRKRNLPGSFQQGGTRAFQKGCTHFWMPAHHRPLFGVQGPALQQDSVRYPDFPYVMHGGGDKKQLCLRLAKPEVERQELCIVTQTLAVGASFFILVVGRLRQAEQGIEIGTL